MDSHLYTFWGRLKNNNSLVTSEGTLHNVIAPEEVLYNVYGYFVVEKRRNGWLIRKYLSETIINTLICED